MDKVIFCKKCFVPLPDGSLFCNVCGWKQSRDPVGRKAKSRGNGTGSVYRTPSGKWQAEVVVGKRINKETDKLRPLRRTKGGFSTKKEALEYIPVLRGGRPSKGCTTLAKLWEGYSTSAMPKLSDSKQTHYRTAYNRIASISGLPIAELTIKDLQDLVDAEAPTFYPARDMKNLLSHLYDRAVAQQDVTVNLAGYIELPPLNEKEALPFDEFELKALWADYAKGNKVTGYVLLMTYSGMMPGELCKARKDMIQWDRQQLVGCGLKTQKRKESPILIADFIIPVLRDLCDLSDGPMLLSVRRDAFYEEFHAVLARCSIADRTPYACRHTTATALALGNIAPEVIKDVMRHTKFDTTKRYIHKEVDTSPMLQAVNSIEPSK